MGIISFGLSAGVTLGKSIYYSYSDGQSNIVMGSADENINQLYQYTPYGVQTNLLAQNSEQSKGVDQDFKRDAINISQINLGYRQVIRDTSTLLLTFGNGYRAYDPVIGSFMHADSDNEFNSAVTNNAFNYALGNPVSYSDPSGHFAMSAGLTSLMMGIAVAVGMSAVTPYVAAAEEGATSSIFQLRQGLFVLGNGAGASVSAGQEFSKGKTRKGIASTLVALSGFVGSWSAQYEYMELNSTDNRELYIAKKTQWVNHSSVASNALMGGSSAVQSPYFGHGSEADKVWRIGASIGAGIAAGYFYGWMSEKLSSLKTNSIPNSAWLGSIRTGITGILADLPNVVQLAIYHQFNLDTNLEDWSVGFGLGAISGPTQLYNQNNPNSSLAVLGRASYLFVKPPLVNAAMSGTNMADYFWFRR